MNPILRRLLAVVAGVLAGIVAIAMAEFVGHLIFPPPEGMDISDPASIAAAMEQISIGALVAVLVAWGIGSMVGGFVAARIDGKTGPGALMVGAVLLLAAIINMLMIPHPVWFWVLGVALFLPLAKLGARQA